MYTFPTSYIVDLGEAYLNRSHVIGPNFVIVKLSGKNKYNLWRLQMECLIKSQHMVGFIDGQFPSPAGNGKGKVGDLEAWIAGDSLVKGWILGSLSEEAARKAVNYLTHKQKNTDFTAKDLWDELQCSYGPSVREQAAETKLMTRQAESAIEVSSISEDAILIDKPAENLRKRWVYRSVLEGQTNYVLQLLEESCHQPWDKITNNGNTILHVVVGSSNKNHELLEKLLEFTAEKTLLDVVNSEGSNLLHVAAIGGNTEAANMLVERNPDLLLATDKEGQIPLALSVSNMHIKTSKCLFEHMKKRGYDALFTGKSGEELVVLAISCQDFSLAKMIINDYDAILPHSDAVLTALAQNFPRELKFWERRGFGDSKMRLYPYLSRLKAFSDSTCWPWLLWTFCSLFIGLCVLPALFYHILKVFARLFVEDTFQTHTNAANLLESIWSTNEDGHNFIQYSVISRSEKIYNLLYEMSEHKNIYKTIKDSFGNNHLHLAARLAPTNKLDLISGAALQIQREIQWFKEVEQFVCPLNRIQKNSDDETPELVFIREHKNLVIEGANWIKKTAESYTITAALIITIVFAAAITVPGGNNQESGIPIFTHNIAFIVFAISDAISLFTAVTSLLMFLSILTARFAEQDFIFKLPTKLMIGLTMLFLSTTTMIIAFGATFFLVFGERNLLMLIPIGALTCLPITSFVTLQCPLIVELISATYGGGIFFREEYDSFY